jgi:hypothetical protein
VTLGVYCNVASGQLYFYDDLYFECANDSYNFDRIFEMFGFDGIRYMCSTSATFPIGSSSANAQLIPDVASVTETYWLTNADEGCFEISNVPVAPTPSAPTALTPSQVPTTQVGPTSLSTPTNAPQEILPLTDSPILSPITPRATTPTVSDNSTLPIGAVVGGVVGGIALALLVIGYFVIRKKSSASTGSGRKPETLDVHSTSVTGTTYDLDLTSAPLSDQSHQNNSSSNEADIVSAPQPPVIQSPPMPISPSSQPQYDVNFKDQARSVIGSPRHMPTVTGVPIQENIPIAVAMDVSGASGGSNATRSEPPGRRIEEP